MEWIAIIVAVLTVIGVAIAVFERRRGRIILAHDLNQNGPQTEADRHAIRATDGVARHMSSDATPPH